MRVAIKKAITEALSLRERIEGYRFHFVSYVTDEKGRQDAKFIDEESSGYDFDYKDEEFILFPGDEYCGGWSYTECEGPTEWEEIFISYRVRLYKTDSIE